MRNERLSSEEARARLRAAADDIHVGEMLRELRGVGLKVALGGLAAGVILGASPAARRAVVNGLRSGYQQVQMMRAQRRYMT